MAAGAGGSLESALDRKFQNVSNTMDSIQGLSTWCIDNKKYHSLVVRHWMKCVRKSDASHRLNLFYLANDIIQNCKRKNAIVYRTAFAEVLRDAFQLVNCDGDQKVIKSVERILSIWEDRGVYSGALITELRSSLVKEESPPETPVEQKTPVESKADLRSKVVAEFVPQALMDELSKYRRSVDEVELREKQLAAMRVDIFSSEALKKLKDKAGGKKFSKDFEEGSAQLQEFVKLLGKHCRTATPLMDALGNADIFYETQYKEVKIVANAYQTFANRVSHLKRKLDSLKATLPDLDESPIPSPSADAPSPTGSESPFHSLADPDPDLDGSAMDDEAEPPAASPLSSLGGSPKDMQTVGETDNREVEDMELSDEEVENGSGIIVEERVQRPVPPQASAVKAESSAGAEPPGSKVNPSAEAPAASVKNVDLAKIGSILNSLSSSMKNTVESPPAAAPPAPVAPQDASSLVNILSKVDVSPADLLSALSKVKGHGGHDGIRPPLSAAAASKAPPSTTQALPTSTPPPQSAPFASAPSLPAPAMKPTPPRASSAASALVQALHRDMDLNTEPDPPPSESLESKIHNFLQANSAFNTFDLGFPTQPAQGGDNLSPAPNAAATGDNQEGTPVRDEGGGTPTQDEMMDKPPVDGAFEAPPVGYHGNSQSAPPPGLPQNGQLFQPYPCGVTAPVAHYQPVPAPTGGAVPGESAPGFQAGSERGWYGDIYPEGSGGYTVTAPSSASGLYPFQTEKPPELTPPQQGAAPPPAPGYFRSTLPPVPKLPPPPPQHFDPALIPQKPPPPPVDDGIGPLGGDGVIGGMVVHDHQHKSVFRPPHPEAPPHRHDDQRRHDESRFLDPPAFQDSPYQQDGPYYRPGSPPHHYVRVRGLTPSPSPAEEPYFPHDFPRHGPPPPRFAARRPPPHLDIRHRGLRPPPRPPHHPTTLLPPPRGPPRPPFPRFHSPDPRMRGKHPLGGPRRGMNAGPTFGPKRPFLPPRY